MRFLLSTLAVVAACGTDTGGTDAARRKMEAAALVARLDRGDAFARFVALDVPGVLGPQVLDASDPVLRGSALVALARLDPEAARTRLAATPEEPPGLLEAAYRDLAARVLAGQAPPLRAAMDGLRAGARRLREVLEEFAAIEDEDAAEERIERLAEARDVWSLLGLTAREGRLRRLASLGLGRAGGPDARERLVALLQYNTRDPQRDGPTRLYAAAGLTLLAHPGTAVDLLLMLSTVNPNDNIAYLATEGQTGEYYTIDAQICDALLGMGLWGAEEELLEQMRRPAYVRVLIDAHAVLRRRTGLSLPFRYNGSYADRDADVAAWERALRATRDQRFRDHPFDASDPTFRTRLGVMLEWLGCKRVNDRYIAQKVVLRIGRYATPFLAAELNSTNRVAQRQAALMMGRIADPAGAPALRAALTLADDDARAEVVDALRKIGDREARARIVPLLADPDAEVRAAAADYLGAHGGDADREPLRKALAAERAPGTITAMACALLARGDRTMVERILRIFVEGEQIERRIAAAALGTVAAPGWSGNADASREERAAAAERFRAR
jgi:HEAT repeat protein